MELPVGDSCEGLRDRRGTARGAWPLVLAGNHSTAQHLLTGEAAGASTGLPARHRGELVVAPGMSHTRAARALALALAVAPIIPSTASALSDLAGGARTAIWAIASLRALSGLASVACMLVAARSAVGSAAAAAAGVALRDRRRSTTVSLAVWGAMAAHMLFTCAACTPRAGTTAADSEGPDAGRSRFDAEFCGAVRLPSLPSTFLALAVYHAVVLPSVLALPARQSVACSVASLAALYAGTFAAAGSVSLTALACAPLLLGIMVALGVGVQRMRDMHAAMVAAHAQVRRAAAGRSS